MNTFRYAFAILATILLCSEQVNAQLPWSENFDSYTAGSGVDGTGNLGDYPGSVSQWSITNIAGLVNTDDYLKTVAGALEAQDVNSAVTWTSQSIDISSCTDIQFSLDITEIGDHEAADFANVEYSVDGGGFILIPNWNSNGDATHTLIGDLLGGVADDDDWGTETVTQTGLTGSSLVIRVSILNNSGSEQITIDNVSVTGTTCGGGVTITAGALTGAPFTVDCDAPTTDNGTISFTTLGTFNVGNTFTAQLSDASGSFASPVDIGNLSGASAEGVDPADVISITIPATTPSGAGYLIRVISNNPSGVGSSSSVFSVTQTGVCLPVVPTTQGLIINEWSNGATGNEEFYEFVVAGNCGTTVDIRGYILDDNNGTFTTPAHYSGTSSGIAPGHFRFAYSPQWAAVPVGSLIVIYNAAEPNPTLPADDPTDSNTDSLYVVPHTNPLFESCTTMPTSSAPDSIYTPCTYSSGGSWTPLSLRNGGDAIQVRNPDGSYYHGVSYGDPEISGGPDNLKLFNGGGGGMSGWFNDGDFFDISNWSSGPVAVNQTPGVPNNPLNAAWLSLMRDPSAPICPITVLPVELIDFTGENNDEVNELRWSTASEENSAYFIIERSSDGKTWENIHQEVSEGSSSSITRYRFYDNDYPSALNYYRLSQYDVDGTETIYSKLVAIDNRLQQPLELVKIVNVLGQEIKYDAPGVQIHIFNDGSSTKIYHP